MYALFVRFYNTYVHKDGVIRVTETYTIDTTEVFTCLGPIVYGTSHSGTCTRQTVVFFFHVCYAKVEIFKVYHVEWLYFSFFGEFHISRFSFESFNVVVLAIFLNIRGPIYFSSNAWHDQSTFVGSSRTPLHFCRIVFRVGFIIGVWIETGFFFWRFFFWRCFVTQTYTFTCNTQHLNAITIFRLPTSCQKLSHDIVVINDRYRLGHFRIGAKSNLQLRDGI